MTEPVVTPEVDPAAALAPPPVEVVPDIPVIDPNAPAPEANSDDAPETDGAEELAEGAGLSMPGLEAEFAEHGALTEESTGKLVAGLEGMGFDNDTAKEMIDGFIGQRMAAAEAIANDLYSIAGSKEQFGVVAEWAGANMDPADVEAFNNTMKSSDLAAQKMAMESVAARYSKANPSVPAVRVQGKATPTAVGFSSMNEQRAAQADPRYSKDAAYRAEVMQKIAYSKGYSA